MPFDLARRLSLSFLTALAMCALVLQVLPACAAEGPPSLRIAAAANLHFAMDQIIAAYRKSHPVTDVEPIYGASGNLTVQIQQGAPFDIFFAADTDFPQTLVASGDAAGAPRLYAVGKLVAWSSTIDLKGKTLSDLAQPRFRHIAIARPETAPYGKRAQQALTAAGIWDRVKPRLVFGIDIGQAAQFARTGNAEVALLAKSIALDPSMGKGSLLDVPQSTYEPLQQSFVITKHGAGNASAKDFADYASGRGARIILSRYGFGLPGKAQ